MSENLDQLTKRPVQYWFEDGLGELVTAIVFILIGGLFLIQTAATQPTVAVAAGILGIIVIGGGPWLSRRLLTRLKERVIYPRTGYVKYPAFPRSQRIISAVAAAAVAGGLVVIANIYEEPLNWLPLIEGTAVGVLLYVQASRVSLLRLHLEALASVLLGAGIAIIGLGDLVGSGLYFLGFGVLLALAGGITFASYLNKYPAPPVEQ